jgi:hypothetical protein
MPDFTIGDIVTVRGYGGMAEVVNMEEDGVTPQGHPKYLCTVDFGPYDDMPGYALKNAPQSKYYGVGRTLKKAQGRLHQFYAGRLTNAFPEAPETEFEREMREVEEEIAELKALIAQKEAKEATA